MNKNSFGLHGSGEFINFVFRNEKSGGIKQSWLRRGALSIVGAAVIGASLSNKDRAENHGLSISASSERPRLSITGTSMRGFEFPALTRKLEYADLMTARRQYLDDQIAQFMWQLPDLLARYEGRYVAFEDGRVLAQGDAVGAVLQQVNAERRAVRPVLVRRVQREYPSVEI